MLVDRPIFLLGSERSGTTLLRLMLDHHPGISFNGESEYIVRRITEDGAYPAIEEFREWLASDRIFQGSRFRIDESLGFVELVNDFLNQKKSRDNKEMVGATIHYQFRKLHRIWPRARYIYLYRDGRDVASSVMRMGWAGNVYVAADWWLNAEKEWDELRSELGREDWLEIRFEDLIANAGSQLERICAFISVPYSENMFNYVGKSTYAAPDVRLNYQWRTGLCEVDVQRLEEKIGDRLLGRGYELSGHPRIPIPAYVRKYLYLQSRAKVFLIRLHRYGVALTLQETLSRRFGLHQVHRNAINRINCIINANLK